MSLPKYKTLWVEEKEPCAAEVLPYLTDLDQAVYRGIKQHRWEYNIRLEQERIAWDYAWVALQQSAGETS